jgi:hypothetical protein
MSDMTHDTFAFLNPCGENLSYLSCASRNAENLSCKHMTHDRYDRWLVNALTRAHKSARAKRCHTCHICHGPIR